MHPTIETTTRIPRISKHNAKINIFHNIPELLVLQIFISTFILPPEFFVSRRTGISGVYPELIAASCINR